MMHPAARRMKLATTEIMLFKVGEELFGVELGQIKGVVQTTPGSGRLDTDRLRFQGRDIPLYGAQHVMPGFSEHAGSKEVLVLQDEAGLFGIAVDGTQGVVEITPGDELYTFPPRDAGDASSVRPWGVYDTGSRLILLLDMSRATAH